MRLGPLPGQMARAKSAIFLTVMIDLLGFGIVIPLLPIYAKTLASHPSPWMAWINHFLGLKTPGDFWAGIAFVSFSIAQFLATPLLGRFSDLAGRRPVLWISLLGSAGGYILLGMSGRFEWVIAARMMSGVMGGNISVAQAAMADLTPPQERSKSMGLIGAAFGIGFVLGPFLGGTLASSPLGLQLESSFGWQLPFLAAAALSFIASLMVLGWLPETLSPETRLAAKGEEKAGHALLRAMQRPGMLPILAVSFLAMAGFAMMEGTYSLLAAERFGLDKREVGYLFGFVGLLMVVYQGGLVRLLARRVPERKAQAIGLLLMALFMPLLAYAPWKWPFVLLMVPLAWGSGMNNTANSALASQLTPPEDQGGLFGVLNAMAGLGRIAGPLVGAVFYARWGYVSVYWCASGIIALGLAFALMLWGWRSGLKR